ncbi:MAG: stage III sporulation AC/AD family protein [Faecalibacterium sp.]|nr:stage III sporulation AC/AD family protein [Ruminococcus sp.]MCM1392732.1 stage III sporulation AC/AD family protein [Ruminococcus sp.]MCM1485202.1 stage III sporulation AC/AD family protein [Faecalibacterium sp.]
MIFKIIIIGILASLISLLLKDNRKEYAVAVQIAALLIVSGVVISTISSRLESFLSYAKELSDVQPIIEIMLKAAIICIMTHFVSDICRESGNAAISDAVEFGGRAVILILALPLIEELLKTAVAFVK